MINALVLVQDFSRAKTRLSVLLNQEQREKLAKKLSSHVIETVKESKLFDQIWIATPSVSVSDWVKSFGVRSMIDPKERVPLALIVDQAVQNIRNESEHPVLILMSDLPYITPDDLIALYHEADGAEVVIGRDRHRLGTNALLLKKIIPTCFGTNDSAERHAQQAKNSHLVVKEIDRLGIAHDIDTQEDFLTYQPNIEL